MGREQTSDTDRWQRGDLAELGLKAGGYVWHSGNRRREDT